VRSSRCDSRAARNAFIQLRYYGKSYTNRATCPKCPRITDLISRNLGRKYSFSAKLEGYLTEAHPDSRRKLNVDGNNERLLTPGEVAALFRVDPKTVTRWAASGRITSIRTPGGHRRFRESEVRALLRGDSEPAPSGHLSALRTGI
jgi:excisionase family DNA binding protein